MFGSNESGQIGCGEEKEIRVPRAILKREIKKIACGFHHTILLQTDGKIFVSGDNEYGQIGLGEVNLAKEFVPLMGDRSFKGIYCGNNFSFAHQESGSLFGFGKNGKGQRKNFFSFQK